MKKKEEKNLSHLHLNIRNSMISKKHTYSNQRLCHSQKQAGETVKFSCYYISCFFIKR
jgi:hypothetical protein